MQSKLEAHLQNSLVTRFVPYIHSGYLILALLGFQFLSSYLDTLRGQMVFSIKIFVFWSLIGCKIAIFGTIFRLRNWFGDSNANCHFTTEICMFVPSNLYMKSKKVSYNCFFLIFSWKRMEKLKNIYLIYKFIIVCPLLSSHPVP